MGVEKMDMDEESGWQQAMVESERTKLEEDSTTIGLPSDGWSTSTIKDLVYRLKIMFLIL